MKTTGQKIASVLGMLLVTCATMARAQQQGAMTDKEKAIQERIGPVLHFALDTLSGTHTIEDAVAYIQAYAVTNKGLVADLTVLSKSEQEGMRNLSLWSLEVAYPDDKAIWKTILRDGKIVGPAYMKESAGHIAGFIKMGVLDWNCGADMHAFDYETEPAMTVTECMKLYGTPDRRGTIQGTEVGTAKKDHKWFFYGPLGVKIDDAEANVMKNQVSLSTVLWIAAMKAYDMDFSAMGDVTMKSDQVKKRIPDLNDLFLKSGSKSGAQSDPKEAKPQRQSLFPPSKEQLTGPNEVRVRNPNEFGVKAGIRSGEKGIDVDVPANGVKSVSIPNGRFDVYFVYSNKPDALFQGDSFTLNDNGVEIQIVKVVNGNYNIRQVK